MQQELKSEVSSINYPSLTEADPATIKREHEGRHSLRIQVEGLKQTVDSLNKDIDDKNEQLKSSEASLRSEVIIPTKMTSLTKIKLESNDMVSSSSEEVMVRRISEDTGVSVSTQSDKSNVAAIEDDLNELLENKNDVNGNDDSDMADDSQKGSSPLPSPLVRYKSLRDHNGRYCLVVRIT